MASRSVILIDFDNIFIGLWALDRDLAVRFASEPQIWLTSLTERYLIGDRRRWLVARCYLNPAGFVFSDAGANGRLYFSRFRPLWVGAGFEVIDTPNLAANKNAADIRIVIDALDLNLQSSVLDEFVIASGDSDFTPLLQRLRASDRQITVMTPGNASKAYTSLADRLIDIDAIEALLRPEAINDAGTVLSQAVDATVDPEVESAFADFIRSQYTEATGPLNIAALAQQAARVVPGARESKWCGAGSFTAAIARLELPNAQFSTIYLWDDERHQEPVSAEPFLVSDLPEVVELLSRTIDLPRLSDEAWPALFAKLALYAQTHEFSLTEATKWTRDELANDDLPVGRGAIGFVVRGAQFGGASLNAVPPPSAEDIANAFLKTLINQAYAAGISIDEDAEDTIAGWLGLSGRN